MDTGTGRATVGPWGHKESDTTERLTLSHCILHRQNIFGALAVCQKC